MLLERHKNTAVQQQLLPLRGGPQSGDLIEYYNTNTPVMSVRDPQPGH